MRRSLNIRWLAAIAAALAVLLALAVHAPNAAADSGSTTVCLVGSNGAGLAGGSVHYWTSGSWFSVGTTDATGCTTGQVVTTNTMLRMDYQHGSVVTGTIDISQGYTFHTVKVTLLNTGELSYQGYDLGFHTYTSPMEMLPFTYTFSNEHFLGHQFQVTVGDTNFTGGVLRLLDHNGNGLAGGTADYSPGSGSSPLPGQTDSNGNLVFSIPSDSAFLNLGMTYLGTRNQQARPQLIASNFTFQTALATVELHDADGNPLDTGAVSYYAGFWRTFGNGATSGGVATQEMMPGNYSFSMVYNHTAQQLNGVAVSASSATAVFQTGRVTLYYSDPIQWNNSQFYAFNKPTMEFLPSTIGFNFGTTCRINVTVQSGDHLVKSGIAATLKNHAGQPIAGGDAIAYIRNAWLPVGTTNAWGVTCQMFDGQLGNTSVRMTQAGTSQMLTQSQPTNSIYNFKTALVTVELKDHAGALVDTGNATYYAAGWHTIGDTSHGKITAEMLPGSYSFAMTFNGTRQQLNGVAIAATGATVDFQTTLVTVELRDSEGQLSDTGSASYYANGWRPIGDTSNGQTTVEMLPGGYSFAMTFNGTRAQQNAVVIGATATTVTFQTALVTIELRDSAGQLLDTGSASYYAGGWHVIGDTSGGQATVEMLPGGYSFAMTYLCTRAQLNGVAVSGTSATVTFQTGAVHSDSASASSYYANGWNTFTQDMELLPGAYSFHFNDGTPNSVIALNGDAINHIH